MPGISFQRRRGTLPAGNGTTYEMGIGNFTKSTYASEFDGRDLMNYINFLRIADFLGKFKCFFIENMQSSGIEKAAKNYFVYFRNANVVKGDVVCGIFLKIRLNVLALFFPGNYKNSIVLCAFYRYIPANFIFATMDG